MGAVVGTVLAVAGSIGAAFGAAGEVAADALVTAGILESTALTMEEIPLIMDGEEDAIFYIFGYEGMLDEGAAAGISSQTGSYVLTGTGGVILTGGAIALTFGILAGGTVLGYQSAHLPASESDNIQKILQPGVEYCTLFDYVLEGRCERRLYRKRTMRLENRGAGQRALPSTSA